MSSSAGSTDSEPDRRRGRPGWIATALALVVAAGAVAYWQLSGPAKPVLTVASGGCWGSLSTADLKPLAPSDNGLLSSDTDTSPLTRDLSFEGTTCRVDWQPAGDDDGSTPGTASLYSLTAADARQNMGEAARNVDGFLAAVNAGPGNYASVGYLTGITIYLPCGGLTTTGTAPDPTSYLAVQVPWGAVPDSHDRQAYGTIAYAVARHAGQVLDCSGAADLPAVTPVMPSDR